MATVRAPAPWPPAQLMHGSALGFRGIKKQRGSGCRVQSSRVQGSEVQSLNNRAVCYQQLKAESQFEETMLTM